MVLDRKDGQIFVTHSFEAAVVEVEMRQLDLVLIQAVRIYSEAVVVRGNLDAAAAHVFDGLIPAAVAEFEFEGVSAERPPEQLVPQTDAEDRRGAE